ncbi:alkene reductase [Pseudoduganella sp. FT55W]|uniref:Alkene reductase n=1 Tax=Duganella rivi TaxID=2666083 RepID=A0A7X4GLI7_9BURK|nr:alkene reductase [Duganella rivi]MYM65712.1 alkene reductase [Duganella rivi]
MPSLFDSIQLGAISAPNRVLMAALTRGRNSRDHVPTEIMVPYYRQRASAGLIITEATGISRQGLGWPYAPGLWSDEQVAAWQPITKAVHEAGGRIFTQLWHMGRVVHPSFLGGAQPVSASATTAPGLAHTYDGKAPYTEARALRTEEIPGIVDDFRRAARNARAAGFDGIQLHAANGYLLDQFMRDNSNHRHDAYGGSVENRIRLLREVTEAVAGEIGADRTSVRLSPNGEIQGVDDSQPEVLFTAAAKALSEIGIAFLEIREPSAPRNDKMHPTILRPPIAPVIRDVFSGPLVLNTGYDGVSGQAALDSGLADAIAYGRPFLANPDLPHRLKVGAALNQDDEATWYSRGEQGYLDYPFSIDAKTRG